MGKLYYYQLMQKIVSMRPLGSTKNRIANAGSGVLIQGILWLVFWIGPAFPLYEMDARWGHNFAIPLIFITVGLAYHSQKLSCQLVAVFASFLTIPTLLGFWSWFQATSSAIIILLITVILYLIERHRNVELINPKPRLKAWMKIHSLTFAYIGLVHMPLIFFLVRWYNSQVFLDYLPVEHDVPTSAFNLMLLVLTPLAAMERYVKKIGNVEVTKLSFLWAMLMIVVPLLLIALEW